MDTPTITDLFREATIANAQAAVAFQALEDAKYRYDADAVETDGLVSVVTQLRALEIERAKHGLYEAQVAASEAVNNARNASTRALTAAFNNGI